MDRIRVHPERCIFRSPKRVPRRFQLRSVRVGTDSHRLQIALPSRLLCLAEAQQHVFDVHQRRSEPPLHLAVSGKWVLFRVVHQAPLHGVEMNVQNEPIQVALILNVFRFISPLPKTACSSVSPVEPATESILNPMHPTPQRNGRCSQDDMEMVGHHTPSENRPAVSFLDVPNDLDELYRLFGISKDRARRSRPGCTRGTDRLRS